MIADNLQFIERFRGTYSKTNQVSSRERMLEKLEIIEIDEVDNSSLKLRFPPSPRSGDYPVTVKDVSKSYGDHVVFKNASMSISRGEKVSFVGRNGEGKSTMIKAIMGQIDVAVYLDEVDPGAYDDQGYYGRAERGWNLPAWA